MPSSRILHRSHHQILLWLVLIDYSLTLTQNSQSESLWAVKKHKFLTLDDESVTYAELRQNLKKCNFSDVEIEMFMSQYDTNENEQIDEDEAIKVFKDLAQGKNITGLQENLPKIKVSRLPPPNEADVEK